MQMVLVFNVVIIDFTFLLQSAICSGKGRVCQKSQIDIIFMSKLQ